jgi:cytochrome c oxidase subunit 2
MWDDVPDHGSKAGVCRPGHAARPSPFRGLRSPVAAMTFPIFPEQASKVAEQTDNLYWGLICASAAVCLVVFVPMFYWLFKYRHGKAADRTPLHLPEMRIEITWTILPTLIFMCFYVWGAEHYFQIERPPSDAMEINVIGKQWMWKIQHPEGNREIDELHVPVGRNVKLTMTSQDVIHSFFLPAFRVKQDVVPGRYTTEWFRAEKIGSYHLFCSEYCGTSHSHMVGRVVVMSPADYQHWLTQGRPDSTLAQSGERLFRELGCSGCHLGQSVIRAPPLVGLYGKPVPLNSGEVVMADEGYLRDSILLPAKQIAGGYTNDMPSFQGKISEEDLLQIIAYLKSLGGQSP